MNIVLNTQGIGKHISELEAEKITDVFVVTAEPEGMERVRRFVPCDGGFEFLSEKVRQAVNPLPEVKSPVVEPVEAVPPAVETVEASDLGETADYEDSNA